MACAEAQPNRSRISDERGSTLVVGLLVLVLLSFMGIAATSTSSLELQIAGNEKAFQIAFYSAEAARGYVARKKDLYHSDNITVDQTLSFPNRDNPSQRYSLSAHGEFNGEVGYLGAWAPPRGSGFEVGKFKAHRYRMNCLGRGPANAQCEIEAGFYRIGF